MEKTQLKVKKIKEFKATPDTSITNEYNTTKNGLRSPYLMIAVGVRNTGSIGHFLATNLMKRTYFILLVIQ